MTRSFSREGRKFRLTSHSVLSAFIAFITRPLLNHIFLFVTWISKYLACGYWGTSKAHSSDRYKLRVRFEVLALVFWGHLFYLDVHLQFNLDVTYIWSVFLLSNFAFPKGFEWKVKSSFTLFKRQEKGSKTHLRCLEGLWWWNKTTSNHIWCSYPSSSLIVTVALRKENYLHTVVLPWMNREDCVSE